jgi:hypothetical protein
MLDDACGIDADLWISREFARDVLSTLNPGSEVERLTVAEIAAWHRDRGPSLVDRAKKRSIVSREDELADEVERLEALAEGIKTEEPVWGNGWTGADPDTRRGCPDRPERDAAVLEDPSRNPVDSSTARQPRCAPLRLGPEFGPRLQRTQRNSLYVIGSIRPDRPYWAPSG